MIPKFSEYFLPFINVIKDGKIYTVKEIRDQIAKDLNSSREVISRLLKKMEQQQKVILHRSYIEYLK